MGCDPRTGKEARKIRHEHAIKLSRFVAAFAVACALAVVLAPSAFAHSVLLGTEPGNDVVVQESPEHVSLRFSELNRGKNERGQRAAGGVLDRPE